MTIRLGDEVMLAQSQYALGKVLCFHTTIGKATVALPQGGTVRVPLSLLSPIERPVARKSAPRPRERPGGLGSPPGNRTPH